MITPSKRLSGRRQQRKALFLDILKVTTYQKVVIRRDNDRKPNRLFHVVYIRQVKGCKDT